MPKEMPKGTLKEALKETLKYSLFAFFYFFCETLFIIFFNTYFSFSFRSKGITDKEEEEFKKFYQAYLRRSPKGADLQGNKKK